MKHHYGDMLDRSGGHWTFTPNVERYAYHMPEWTEGQKAISIATISADDSNWQLVATFPNLVELTLHSPSQEQLEFVSRLWRLQRLRITHARPKTLDFLARLQNIEELILEYVSGFSDLSPVGALTKLTALHLENLRKVSDFSPLGKSASIKYLSIDGTLDWDQPVESFDFLGEMKSLEYLRLVKIRAPKVANPLASLAGLPNLSKLLFASFSFPIETFAWLEAKIPHVDGAVRAPFDKFGGTARLIEKPDIRATMPDDEFAKLVGPFLGEDGKRYHWEPHQAFLLGRGQRLASGKEESVNKACETHAAKYRALVDQFRAS